MQSRQFELKILGTINLRLVRITTCCQDNFGYGNTSFFELRNK